MIQTEPYEIGVIEMKIYRNPCQQNLIRAE